MHSTSIRYIPRADIDVQKWNACIRQSMNGLIYAYSFYLDRMSKHWDGLVLDDYNAVMPLTWNKKAGFHYLYQPAFTPILGVFGENLNEKLVEEFILAIPKKFKLVEINLNTGNQFKEVHNECFNSMPRKNHVLPLKRPYNKLYNGYNDNIKRNIKKSVSLGCTIERNLPIERVITLAKKQQGNITNVKNADLENFIALFNHLASMQMAVTYGIFLKEELLSSAAYFYSNGRAFYILVGNHPNGKTMGTSHYLIDRFIADHAVKDLTLDFEGSDIQSLAFFYSSFGAKVEYYPAIRMNRLPWTIRWLK